MNLSEKILDIMQNVQYLAKDDQVKFKETKYKALSEEKVTSIMRKQMVEHKLIVFPIKQETRRDGQISHVDVTYRIVNVDNPEEYIDVVSAGDGWDSQDKGAGKAMTYAFKYMWLRTFAIPTGEDPDKISSDEIDEIENEATQKQTPPQTRPQTEILFRCARCSKTLRAYKFNGTPKSLRAHSEWSEKQYGSVLCVSCLNDVYPDNPLNKGVIEWI